MTDAFVKEQVRAIEEATKKATRSKESALRFLREAGIIKDQLNAHNSSAGSKKSRKKK